MLLAFLWTPLRHNPNVFTAMFCIAHGPLPWAVRVGLPARAAVLRQLQLADWSFVPRHCCDAACLASVEAAVTCFASSFFIIKKKADEKLRHNTNTAEQSKRVRRQVLLFRNSLVFHSLERITSCFIHISPM